jgi:ribosomal protein S17
MKAFAFVLSFVMATAVCSAAQNAEHIVSGTVTKIDQGAKTVTIKTAGGTEETVELTEKTAVKAGEGTAHATATGVKQGDHVVVHYSAVAGQKTALAVKTTGDATAKAAQGTIVGVDKAAKTVTVQAADGSKETYHLAQDGVLETGKAAGKAGDATAGSVAKGSKVTVHYTEDAGRKIAHGIDHIF